MIPELGRSPGEGNGIPASTLAWEIPWTEGPGGLPSMGSQGSDTTATQPPTPRVNFQMNTKNIKS